MNSIMQEEKHCYVCSSTDWLSRHHCIEGSGRRAKSEKYGLVVILCNKCHTAVHCGNSELQQKLREEGQKAFEKLYSREDFQREFGMSFLEEEER